MKTHSYNSQSGNVLFYIFMAVGLLGALSFAVTQSSRSGEKTLSEDRAQLAASEIMSYGDTVAKAVGQLRLRGVQEYAMSFAEPTANPAYGTYDTQPRSEIFNPQGAGVLYRPPPESAGTGAVLNYEFTGGYGIQEVGSTCATAGCSDLIMVVQGLRKEVCQMANGLLDIGLKSDDPPEDSTVPIPPYFVGNATGTPNPYSYSAIIGASTPVLRNHSAGCYYNSSITSYIYYQVLISR